MAITYEPRLALPQWNLGSDPFLRAQVDDAFAKLGTYAARGEQGPLSQLPAPAAPTLATANVGGTLAAGVKGYRITALSAAGGSFAAGETAPSAETTINVPAGTATNTVTVNWVAVPGATGYRIYGRTAGAELLLATVGAVVTWTDTGAGVPAGAMPAVNTTAGRPAPGIRNRTYWASDDRGGRYSYDDGANWFDLGPSPVTGPQTGSTALIVGHAAAATSDAVLIARGKTGQTGDLLKLQDPTAATDLVRVSSAGALFANAGATVRPAAIGTVGLVVNGLSGQTADLQQWQANGATVGKIDAAGGQTITRPAAGISQTIATEAATVHDGSLVISRSTTAAAQSIAFAFNTATSMAIGRAASTDDLSIRSWDGTTERQLYKFAATQAILTLDSQLATGNVSNYVQFARQGTFKSLIGVSKGGGDLATGDADGDVVVRYAAGVTSGPGVRFATDARTNVVFGTKGAISVTPQSDAGTALTVNPDTGYTNTLQTWQIGGVEKARVGNDGSGLFIGSLIVGPAAFGATSGRHRLSADGTWAYFVAEDQAASITKGQMFQAGSGGWLWQASAATVATLTAAALQASPADNYFGSNALGGTGTRIHIGSLGSTVNASVIAEGSGANTALILQSSGTSSTVKVQPNGIVAFTAAAAGGFPAIAFYGGATIGKQTIAGAKGGNAALTSLINALSTLGLVTDTTT